VSLPLQRLAARHSLQTTKRNIEQEAGQFDHRVSRCSSATRRPASIELLVAFSNSPSGKQFIDQAKHKLVMKLPVDSLDLAEGDGTPASHVGRAPRLDATKRTRDSLETPLPPDVSHARGDVHVDRQRATPDPLLAVGPTSHPVNTSDDTATATAESNASVDGTQVKTSSTQMIVNTR
jgi:hypothetical protein